MPRRASPRAAASTRHWRRASRSCAGIPTRCSNRLRSSATSISRSRGRGRRRAGRARRIAAWCATAILLGAAGAPSAAQAAAGAEKFQSDEWVTECDPAGGGADCSITAPFWDEQGGRQGSFALVVMLQAGEIAIVGQPYPTRAILRIDKNSAIECRQTRYCLFPGAQARTFIAELAKGAIVFVDVFAGTAGFHFSLTTKGYRAGLAKIGAWGYRFSGD